jgi:hypothetical protein
VFVRGNAHQLGQPVPRRFLQVLSGPDRKPFGPGSGRLELARAIASRDNPLTARVLVNRVWMHHFGSPLVETPSDFGLRSAPPSHPELLDHLAWTFMNEGWSIKALHRRILLSSAYRQASADRPECRQVDPENRLLWRMNRRRLDFESTRDALLAASGRLAESIGGPSVKGVDSGSSPRRSLYGYLDRQNLPSLYRAFDFPDPTATSPRRDATTIPPQALYFMNHPFVVESAASLVRRPDLAAADPAGRIARIYGAVFQRAPTAEEVALGRAFLAEMPGPAAWPRYAQALLMTNEFLFID